MSSDVSDPISVTVSIINYRTPQLTLACVQSVVADLALTPRVCGQVVIVDNASNDGSLAEISAWIATNGLASSVTLLPSTTNMGFSGGHNAGMWSRPAEYYLVLNSDAVLRPGFFAALIEGVANDPDAGLYVPRLEDPDGKQQVNCFRFPSPCSELIRGAASGPVTKLLARFDVPRALPHSTAQDGWASFACVLIQNRLFRSIGPMDEGYFLYFEDAEYAWRAKRAGWRLRHLPQARVIHFRGGSGPVKQLARMRKRLPGYYYASRTRFFRQVYGPLGPFLANIMWCLGRVIARLRAVIGRPMPMSYERECRDIWINFRAPLGNRFGGKKHASL